MSIKRARSRIRKAFTNDPQAGIEGRSNNPPTNINTVEGCNSMAERIIDLIFSV